MPVEYLRETPSQTAGPYVHIGCIPSACGIPSLGPDLGSTMITGKVKGQLITLKGTVYDGFGTPLKDAMVEIWQPDSAGLFPGHDTGADPNFTGFGRTGGDFDTGEFTFHTVKPGRVQGFGKLMAPHLSVWIAARGVNVGLQTRVYFEDEASNADCPVLNKIEQVQRRDTLIAKKEADGSYRWNVYLQGPNETVFLDV